MSNTEIEIEIRAKAPKNIIQILRKMGAKKINEYAQLDRYYMFKEGFIFRVRNNRIFTIKCNIDNRDNGWYEWESEVKDARGLEGILLKCGFELFGEINKKRQQYKYGEFEINLDDVKNLGKFIEIEIFHQNKDKGLEKVKKLMDKMGIKKVINKGYINIIRERKNAEKSV